MHKHHWECTDTPGIYMCHSEGTLGYWDSLAGAIVEEA